MNSVHDVQRLAGLDLNLVLVLDALLREGHVTRAAAALGLSQSAASHALARLRVALSDPLLVRDKGRLVPTPRAEALRAPLSEALAALGRALAPPEVFDPATARRTFTIAAADYAQIVVLPALVERLRAEAPGIDLVARDGGPGPMSDGLGSGAYDLAIAPPRTQGNTRLRERVGASEEPAWVRSKRLFSERFVCVVRQDHPEVGRRLDLDQFVSMAHAFVAPRGTPGGIVDDVLAERGLTRRVALMVQSFLVAPWAIMRSDLVITLAERLARALEATLPLKILDPPIALPRFSMALLWHERQHNDPGHKWLRELVFAVGRVV